MRVLLRKTIELLAKIKSIKMKILRLDSSARYAKSISRNLADNLCQKLQNQYPNTHLVIRDLNKKLPVISENTIVDFSKIHDLTDAQKKALAKHQIIINELKNCDILLISAPMYNYTIPATLKAWIDVIIRVKQTFDRTERGFTGLLSGKKAYITMALGATKFGSDMDFASKYLIFILNFVGITDITFIYADQLMMNPNSITEAHQQIENLKLD
jgi:FMN-dependent NADH-azoreductase